MANKLEVIASYHTDVIENAESVDPTQELDWFALWVGYAIAKGMTPDEAADYDFYMKHVFPLETEVDLG